MGKIRVAVSGACGRMGQKVCETILLEEGLELAGAFDLQDQGKDLGLILENRPRGIVIEALTPENLKKYQPDVMVDFTTPMVVMQNINVALKSGVRPVVGTTGITQVDLAHISEQVEETGLSAMVAPNFALGAVLMMKFAATAARYFSQAEIIELHHDKKIDAPSGTALKTAEMIAHERQVEPVHKEELLKLPGARGALQEEVHIHSVRLNGLIAHQEVLFGGPGQTLLIRHDSYDRGSFMPGVVLAVKNIIKLKGLVYGLENLLNL